jgi:DNA-binding PadR family transcriptional regulator
VDLQLLLALTQGEQHGYGLVRAIEHATDGLVVLDPGNLYRVIKRLLADGLVVESERRRIPDEGGGEERRRYYRITGLGGRVVAEELRRLQRLVASPVARGIARGLAT